MERLFEIIINTSLNRLFTHLIPKSSLYVELYFLYLDFLIWEELRMPFGDIIHFLKKNLEVDRFGLTVLRTSKPEMVLI